LDISFKTNKLRKCANNDVEAVKRLGPKRAALFKRRLDDLMDSHCLEDVRYLPGSYHELKGDRKGQWACSLDHPYRLIFQPQVPPIPTNPTGQRDWRVVKAIEIVEIIDYH